jgi:hypothetical protein
MKTEQKAVKHKGKLVSTITVPVYETLDEAIADPQVGAVRVLALFNKQNIIQLQAAERHKFAEGPAGKNTRKEIAFNLLTTEEIQRYAGNFKGLQDFLTSADMATRVDAYLEEQRSEGNEELVDEGPSGESA